MNGYELSPEARDDLQEIWMYIASDNPSAADKLEEHVYATCAFLSENPYVGHKRPDLTDDPARFWPIREQYLVIYLPDAEPLKIVRILQGARDASSQLQ